MKQSLKVAALAIAGACLTVLTYILGHDDGVRSLAPISEVPEPNEEELGADTQ